MTEHQDQIVTTLDAWTTAERDGDVASLDTLLAADFAGIGPLGFTLTRAAWLERHEAGALSYDGFELRDRTIRVYGTAGVVTGTQVAKGSYGGHPIPPENRITIVLDGSRSGAWTVVACHLSFVAGSEGAPPLPGRA